MALFGRGVEEEFYSDYAPLEEFAPTYSRQEVIAHKKLSKLLSPIRDIPMALRGRRDQIENDLSNFCMEQDQDFEEAGDTLKRISNLENGHIQDVVTLKNTMEQVKGAIEALSESTTNIPALDLSTLPNEETEIPQINLPKLSEEYMPESELVEKLRSYSSFSHILRKSTEYVFSALEQYHDRIQSLSERRDALNALSAKADLVALNTTIEATHMNDESREFSTKVASEIGDLARQIHEVSAALDAELDALENGYKTVFSSIQTIESAHKDAISYADNYSRASNEFYRQSTNYTNILIQSLSALNKEFRAVCDSKDKINDGIIEAVHKFIEDIEKYSNSVIHKGDRIESVLDGCIRGASSLSEEMTETLKLTVELLSLINAIQKTDSIRKDKYSSALLKAFDQDLIWLRDKIESVFEAAEDE